MYEVILYPEAQQFYATADKALANKIAKCLMQLEQNPHFHPNIKSLKGNYTGYYRYRVGEYRVIYSIDDEAMQVVVDIIVHRSQAYNS